MFKLPSSFVPIEDSGSLEGYYYVKDDCNHKLWVFVHNVTDDRYEYMCLQCGEDFEL